LRFEAVEILPLGKLTGVSEIYTIQQAPANLSFAVAAGFCYLVAQSCPVILGRNNLLVVALTIMALVTVG
jgi:hypothetical protein